MLCPVMTFDMLRGTAALAGSGSKKSSKDELWGEDCAVAAQNLYSWCTFMLLIITFMMPNPLGYLEKNA